MARIVKPDEYNQKRTEILDAATRLIYQKGYEQMTIQDIQKLLGISKGAFYHYFRSKDELLSGILDRLGSEIMRILEPISLDPNLDALSKMRMVFDTASAWKAGQKGIMIELIQVWYQDENALVRQKMYAETSERLVPILARIIDQGIREKVMSTPFPTQSAEVIYAIFQGVGANLPGLMMTIIKNPDHPDRPVWIKQIQDAFDAYSVAIERTIGAPPGSIPLMKTETLALWFPPGPENDFNVIQEADPKERIPKLSNN